MILKQTHCEFPEEVVYCDVSGLNLNKINATEVSLFENIKVLVANYNSLNLDQFQVMNNLIEI